MGAWVGPLYTSATLTASGSSDWFAVPPGVGGSIGRSGLVTHAKFYAVSTGVAGDETLVVDVDTAWDSSGTGGVTAGITSAEINAGATSKYMGYSLSVTTNYPIGPYLRCRWTIGGADPSLSFVLWASLVGQ